MGVFLCVSPPDSRATGGGAVEAQAAGYDHTAQGLRLLARVLKRCGEVHLLRPAQSERRPGRVSAGDTDAGPAARIDAMGTSGWVVEFSAPQNALVFRADDLDAALPTANPVLVRISEQALDRYAARIASEF